MTLYRGAMIGVADSCSSHAATGKFGYRILHVETRAHWRASRIAEIVAKAAVGERARR